MKVYRISKNEYAHDLTGTGARLFGGRWNHINVPCLYTAGSAALAVLEYSVNVNVAFVPRRLSLAVFEIEEKYIHVPELFPADWATVPAPLSAKDFGSEFLYNKVPVIRVPSVVIPSEYNYLLNPSASGRAFRLLEVREFTYDMRIKK
ncbi:MAG: RES family NAD+ phosphorylase [Leadbetterella sp.]|nr:RES family NAD+ phosphorylase [Leadbetterella sp.]